MIFLKEESFMSSSLSFQDILVVRFSRRSFLEGTGILLGANLIPSMGQALEQEKAEGKGKKGIPFKPVPRGASETHQIAQGFEVQILLRWGDPIFLDAPVFDPHNQTAQTQALQFGYNNDFVGFAPLPRGSKKSDHGILCVNHEYPDSDMMFSGMYSSTSAGRRKLTEEECAVQKEAVGNSLIEIQKDPSGQWKVIQDSPFNRRVTSTTLIKVHGPAARHPRLQTEDDPMGEWVKGTNNNCSGGITPWGTYLTCEENIDSLFTGELNQDHLEFENAKSFGIPSKRKCDWGVYDKRFDVEETPHEINRFGWVVEIDPYNPRSVPIKRTALGRFKHEACNTKIAPSGKVVAYMGDDQENQHLYKFISHGVFNPYDLETNRHLLDEGVLYVARFDENGRYVWIPLIYGQGELIEANGFYSQADVVIDARKAARLMGATPMDRPEDVEPHPRTGRVYVSLTGNKSKTEASSANPRIPNIYGHILEMTEDQNSADSLEGNWEILLFGNPQKDPHIPTGGLCCPDNLAFGLGNNLWVTTDQGSEWKEKSGYSDALWWVGLEGDTRGEVAQFFRVPWGAEATGSFFTPDSTSLFLSVQHPGYDGMPTEPTFNRWPTIEDPGTRWPDFDPKSPTRPSVVAIRHHTGKPIP
jgi:uncharacterized protein